MCMLRRLLVHAELDVSLRHSCIQEDRVYTLRIMRSKYMMIQLRAGHLRHCIYCESKTALTLATSQAGKAT